MPLRNFTPPTISIRTQRLTYHAHRVIKRILLGTRQEGRPQVSNNRSSTRRLYPTDGDRSDSYEGDRALPLPGQHLTAAKSEFSHSGTDGFCRICSRQGKLTYDHVPPKGCAGFGKMSLHNITNYLGCQPSRARLLQRGMRFRTICQKCNNERLGHEYDPTLKDLAARVSTCVRANAMNLVLPGRMQIDTKPQRLGRAVVGHLLAADTYRLDEKPHSAPFPDAMQSYFLNPEGNPPDQLEIYYWLYPSDINVIINFCAIMSLRGSSSTKSVLGCFLRFYPVAFWVVWERPRGFILKGSHALPIRNVDIDEVRAIPLELARIPRPDWPECPGDDGIVIGNEERTFIARKLTRTKK